MTIPRMPLTVEQWNDRIAGTLPGLIGLTIDALERGRAEGHLDLRPDHLAPNGYLHAATVIALADTLAGAGTTSSYPEGATGFTTIEVKSNFLGTAREGTIRATATLAHGGRTTQVWDALVVDGAGKTIALFRCTQMILYPRA